MCSAKRDFFSRWWAISCVSTSVWRASNRKLYRVFFSKNTAMLTVLLRFSPHGDRLAARARVSAGLVRSAGRVAVFPRIKPSAGEAHPDEEKP